MQGGTTPPSDQSVRCPQCGGENGLPSGQHVFTCVFCDVPLYVDRGRVVSHYRLPSLIDEDQALGALRRWMAGNETVKDLDRKAEVSTCEALRFPVWLFRVLTPDGETVLVEPAAPPPIPPLAGLQIPAGRLEPFQSSEDGDVDREVSVPADTARLWVEQQVSGTIRETALVRVPLWECRYRYEGRDYTALVEASTGQVLAAVFPEKAESPFLLIAALGLLLFGVEGLAISNPLLKLVAYVVTALPLTAFAYWVARRV